MLLGSAVRRHIVTVLCAGQLLDQGTVGLATLRRLLYGFRLLPQVLLGIPAALRTERIRSERARGQL